MIDVDWDKGEILIYVLVNIKDILMCILKIVIDLIKERIWLEIVEYLVL